MDQKDVELIRSEVMAEGFFRLDRHIVRHRKFDGGWTEELPREVFTGGDAVCVLAYDPRRDEVVMIEEFRIVPYVRGESPWMISIVAGLFEEGEEPEDVAQREAMEEAGLELEGLEYMLAFDVSPGATNQRVTLFCGIVDSEGAGGVHGVPAEHEDIRVLVMPFDEAISALDNEEITSSPAVISLQWLALNRERIRREAGV